MTVALFPATISALTSNCAQVLPMSTYLTTSRVSEDVLDEARETLHPQQYARLFRGGTEDISLLNFLEGVTVWMFMIQASSGAEYMITVDKSTMKVTCNCPDASHTHTLCKHVCWFVFVLLEMTDLRVFVDHALPASVANQRFNQTLLPAGARHALSPADISVSASSRGPQYFQFALDPESSFGTQIGTVQSVMEDSDVPFPDHLTSDHGSDEDPELQGSVFLDGHGGSAPPGDAECCVCYEDLGSEDETKIVHCPGCRNHFHALCILQWMARGKNSCPLCRHHK